MERGKTLRVIEVQHLLPRTKHMDSDRVLVARDFDSTHRILARPVVVNEVAEGFREGVQVMPDRDLADRMFLTSPRFVVVYMTAEDGRHGSVRKKRKRLTKLVCSRFAVFGCFVYSPSAHRRKSAAASLKGLTWSLSS